MRLALSTARKCLSTLFSTAALVTEQEISDAVKYGVIKMNIDTDLQYAFTRPVVDHMLKNYDGVLRIDGEVGNKKLYDPRAWGKSAEAGMSTRVVEAATQLGSAGKSKW